MLQARHHIDGANVLPQARDPQAFQLELQRLRYGLRGQPHQTKAFGVHGQVQYWHPVVPLQVWLDHVRISRHDIPDAMTDLAQYQRIGPDQPQLDGPVHRRPIQQTDHPNPCIGKLAIRNRLPDARHNPVARTGVVSNSDDPGERRVGHFRIRCDEESGRAGTNVGGIAAHVIERREQCFQLVHHCIGRGDAAALGHVDADHHLRSVRDREELLLHQENHGAHRQRQ
ncbi:hypothetical protein D9M69_542960 [compost metagenome]